MTKKISPAYLYSFLIFIGFYSKFIYYKKFDINISSYLSFSELLLSFLELSYSFVLVFFFFMFAYFYHTVYNLKENKKKKKYLSERILNEIEVITNELKNKRLFSFLIIPFHSIKFMLLASLLLAVAIYPVILIYMVIFDSSRISFLDISVEQLIIPTLIFILFFKDIINISKRLRNESDLMIDYIIIAILVFISLITVENRHNANKVLNGISEYEIEFKFDESLIKSDENLIFIGMTEKYVFLRKNSLNENQIFSKDRIKIIKLKLNHLEILN